MELTINGEYRELAVATIYDIIVHYHLLNKPVVVEVDGAIVARERWQETRVTSGMAIELVHFVGGG
jgi:sulfur carrier protein